MASIAQNKIRIRLKAYDHSAIETAAKDIVETATRTGATVSGPVPLPTEKNVYAVIKSPFKDKDSQEHFEIRTHKRHDRHPSAHPEDRRLAPAPGPPPGRRRHRDPARVTMPAILAKKLGMTQVFQEDGRVERVTVLEAGPCPVTAIRTHDVDGYEAVQLAFGATQREAPLQARARPPQEGRRARPCKHVVEFRDEAGELHVGDTVTVEAFEVGQKVKVAGVSKGKGFQGGIKRHGFSRGPVSTARTTSAPRARSAPRRRPRASCRASACPARWATSA